MNAYAILLLQILLFWPLQGHAEEYTRAYLGGLDPSAAKALKEIFKPDESFWKEYQTLIAGILSLFAGAMAIVAGKLAYNGAIEAADKQVSAIRNQIEFSDLLHVRSQKENARTLASLIFSEMSALSIKLQSNMDKLISALDKPENFDPQGKLLVDKEIPSPPVSESLTPCIDSVIDRVGALPAEASFRLCRFISFHRIFLKRESEYMKDSNVPIHVCLQFLSHQRIISEEIDDIGPELSKITGLPEGLIEIFGSAHKENLEKVKAFLTKHKPN